jgi:hypothetical protein
VTGGCVRGDANHSNSRPFGFIDERADPFGIAGSDNQRLDAGGKKFLDLLDLTHAEAVDRTIDEVKPNVFVATPLGRDAMANLVVEEMYLAGNANTDAYIPEPHGKCSGSEIRPVAELPGNV